MFSDPFIEGLGDRFLPAGQRRYFQDVAQEIHQRGLGLAVGFAQSPLGYEQIRSFQYGGEGGIVVCGQLVPVLQPSQRRVIAGKDNMGGTAANRLTTSSGGVAGTTLGAVGGSETHTLTAAQLPSHTHTGTTASSGNHSHTVSYVERGDGFGTSYAMSVAYGVDAKTTSTAGAHTHTFTTASTGDGDAPANVQPTIVLNKIIRAI